MGRKADFFVALVAQGENTLLDHEPLRRLDDSGEVLAVLGHAALPRAQLLVVVRHNATPAK